MDKGKLIIRFMFSNNLQFAFLSYYIYWTVDICFDSKSIILICYNGMYKTNISNNRIVKSTIFFQKIHDVGDVGCRVLIKIKYNVVPFHMDAYVSLIIIITTIPRVIQSERAF